MSELLLQNITQKYLYGYTGVKNLTQELKINQLTAVFGQEESGKTSLLKCIAGLVPLVEGDILYNNKSIINVSVKEKDISFLYQENSFFNTKSVKYNLIYPLKIRKIEEAKIEVQLSKIVKKFTLDDIINTKVKYLSDIELLKVGFARLFMRESAIVLIDNPFSTLQKEDRKNIFDKYLPFIKELSERSVVVFSTNSLYEASKCDKVVILNYGINLMNGSFCEIKERPNCLFIRELFNKELQLITEELLVKKDDIGVYFAIDGEKIYNFANICKYLDKEVLVSYNNNLTDIKIFDKNKETLID